MQALHAFENTAVRQTGHLDSVDLVSDATREHERTLTESHSETAEHIAGGLWTWRSLVAEDVACEATAPMTMDAEKRDSDFTGGEQREGGADLKHTPGPWRVLTPRKAGGAMGDWGDRAILAGEGPDTLLIAEVFERTADKLHLKVEGTRLPTWANAMLVSAAPDLLEALCGNLTLLSALLAAHQAEPFRDHLDPAKRFQNDLRNQVALTRAAIRKATGAP